MVDMKKIFLLGAAVFTLAGCQHEKSYSYLVRHPMVLKQEVANCQNGQAASAGQYCENVMLAARDFMAMVDEWQSNQEAFGQKVLQAQLDCTKAADGVKTAKVELKDLQDKKADGESIQLAKEKLALAQKDSEEKRRSLQTMYGVLSLSTPE